MEIDKNKQEQARARAREIIANAEKKREVARVEKGIQEFLRGKFDMLSNDEFVENLASYILDKYILGEKETAIKIVGKLGQSLCTGDVSVRERSMMVVSVFTEIILEEDYQEFREILARNLVEWLRFEEEYIAGFETVCSQLQRVILTMLEAGEWHELENLVTLLQQISTGEIAKSSLIRGMAAKVHENLAEPDILEKLSNVYLDESDDRRTVAENLLVHMGKFSVTFLVGKMIYSNSKEARLLLINLVPRFGELSVPILTKCLDEEPPWYVIRNIVLIISRLEDPNLFPVIEPYLTHRDMRVQQQVVNCIESLAGKHVRKRMIQALMKVNDELKGQLVIQLGQFEGMDVGYAFLDLIEQYEAFASHVRDNLLQKLCVKIKSYPSKRAVGCLEELIEDRTSRFGETDKIIRSAAASLQAMEMNLKDDEQEDHGEEKELMARLHALQSESSDLFSEDEIETMSDGSELLETAGKQAGETGVKPRKAGEELPFYSSQEHHLEVWSKIYEQMQPEELDEFYSLLKPVSYQANDEIVLQGDKVQDLFFIDNGFAGLTHVDKHSEIILTSLQAGEIIGNEGFASGLAWSVSLLAQTDLQVRILDKDSFAGFAEKYPECTKRLYHYCNHYDVVPYLINLTHDDDHEPLDMAIDVRSNKLLRDSSGEIASYVVSGTVHYVARGGCCLSLDYINENNVTKILGRQVSTEITLADDLKRKCFGVIVGAGMHDEASESFFLYVKFYNPFDKADFTCTGLEIM